MTMSDEMEDAKKEMIGAFDPLYNENSSETDAGWAALEEAGIYPQSVMVKGIETKRTEWQEGWNAAVMQITRRYGDLKSKADSNITGNATSFEDNIQALLPAGRKKKKNLWEKALSLISGS